MERGVKRTLSESSSDDTDVPHVGFKIPKKQSDQTPQQQQQHRPFHISPPTFHRRESQTSTISSTSATSVSEDDELDVDGQQLSQVSFLCCLAICLFLFCIVVNNLIHFPWLFILFLCYEFMIINCFNSYKWLKVFKAKVVVFQFKCLGFQIKVLSLTICCIYWSPSLKKLNFFLWLHVKPFISLSFIFTFRLSIRIPSRPTTSRRRRKMDRLLEAAQEVKIKHFFYNVNIHA